MKVGFIVDGISEIEALPNLFRLLSSLAEFQPIRPLRAAVGANAPIDTISVVIAERLGALADRNPELVIVLWDREQRTECSASLARQLRDEIDRRHNWTFAVEVVIKDRMFENWLVAALPTMQGRQARFHLSQADLRSIRPNKADNVDALALMKKAVTRDQYEKVADSKRVLAAADVDAMAANSRSFRRFLRCLGHPDYLNQSKSPRRS